MKDHDDPIHLEPETDGAVAPEVAEFISQATADGVAPPDISLAEPHHHAAESAAPLPAIPPKPNRRTQPRYFARWRAALVVAGDKYFGKTENVSLTGVALISPAHLSLKQEVTLYLEVTVALGKPPEIFEAVAVVMHSTLSGQEFRLGVAFRFFQGDSLEILKKALRSGNYRQMIDPQFD